MFELSFLLVVMRVVLFLLKCLLGLFASLGVLMVCGVILVTLLWSESETAWRDSVDEVPERSVLMVDLGSGLLETEPENFVSRVSLGDTLLLRDLLDTIESGGRDPRVAGLIAHVGRGELGLADVQELREAIASFRAQGKFAYGFAESFGEAGNGTFLYYLGSAFEQIWLQPSGDLDLTGVFLESPYFRSVLDELGITARIGQREEYKGAMASLTDDRLPEPQRRNLQRLVESWVEQIAQGVAENRSQSPDAIRRLIDAGPYLAQDALKAGLVDHLGYWDQFIDAALETAKGSGDEAAELLALADYQRLREAPAEDGPVIALIYGLGPVSLGDSENDPLFGQVVMGSDTVAQAFSDAVEDEEVEAIVFRIDSPGGSYVASDTIWREVSLARDKGKPVIVSMGNLAASGGYFVAAPADKIVAQPGTITGSIGVVAGKVIAERLWDKLGITWDGVQAGANADIWSMNRDFTPQGWTHLQKGLDRSYGDFRDKVASGRDLSGEQVTSAAKGQVWTGADAQRLGLVDELGGFRRSLSLAREAAGLGSEDPIQLREFPQRRSGFEVLLENTLSEEMGGGSAAQLLRGLARFARLLTPLVEAAEQLTGDPRRNALRAPDLVAR